MKICCLFLTCANTTNPAVWANYNIVSKMCYDMNIDLYLYLNDETREYDNVGNTCYFSYEYFRKRYNYYSMYMKSKPFYGLMNLPLLDLYETHPEYDHYIFYEDDIVYYGSKNLFSTFDYRNDIIFQDRRRTNEFWYWYTQYNNYSDEDKKKYKPVTGCLHIFSMSNKCLSAYKDFINNTGLCAHHEYSINSFAEANKDKFKIGVIPNEISKNCSWDGHGLDKDGYDLIHPVKNLDTFIKYQNAHRNRRCSESKTF